MREQIQTQRPLAAAIVAMLTLLSPKPALAETLPEALPGLGLRHVGRGHVAGVETKDHPAILARCTAAESEVRAANLALSSVQKEAQGGQRTTLDVLNSQQGPHEARARLIGAQRDRVIATYALLSATGRLDVKTLGLNTSDYSPEVHYQQVRDAWGGLRTPSGQ